MSDALSALEAVREQRYCDNIVKPITGRDAFIDDVTALEAPPVPCLNIEEELPL